MKIDKTNVGKIGERIVMNELAARGFAVTDLNKDGVSANADIIAVRARCTVQIQVKGATNKPASKLWFGYGHCNDRIVKGEERMFNRRRSAYRADFVVLVAVRGPAEYRCVILRASTAERAAQLNLENYYRRSKADGTPHKPGKVWVRLDEPERRRPLSDLKRKEWRIIRSHLDRWDVLRVPIGSRKRRR